MLITQKKSRSKLHVVHAPPGQCFWTTGGHILQNLKDLERALQNGMSDAEYAQHANREKNDFAKWTEEVLGDAACAKVLRGVKSRKAAAAAVTRALKRYA